MVMRARWRGFELPTTIYAEKDTLTASYGKFVAEPFERGFGITIGNSLRRVLLSSLEGAAATRVKIEGVLHEFSSLPGVVEDVTDIVLNVKQLLVKVRSDEPQKLVLDVKKKGIVRAGDFAAHSLVQVVNPDLHLAELSEDVRFKMEVWVQRGRGYVTAEENDSEDREIGVIPIDSVYSPVRRVRYRTENTRVGQLTDYDKLVLEVWTDGTVHPELALVEAAKILRKHLISFVGYGSLGHELPGETFEPELEAEEEDEEGAEASEAGSDKETSRAAKPTVDLTRGVRSLDLGQRTVNALEGAGIESLVDLIQQSEDDLLKLRNFGRTSLKEVQTKLADLGLELSSAATAGA